MTYSSRLTWPPGYAYQPLRRKCNVTDGRDAPVSRLVSLGVTSTACGAAWSLDLTAFIMDAACVAIVMSDARSETPA